MHFCKIDKDSKLLHSVSIDGFTVPFFSVLEVAANTNTDIFEKLLQG